ncbi:MAG: tryptophan-rich sensory protein [Flavobacteriaceae bacterium]
MTKKLAFLNLFSVILAIAVNYVSQAVDINGTDIGEISRRYDNLFTPAAYAFAIWGPIFLALLAYALFQIRRAFFSNKNSDFIEQTGYWFLIANVLNATWVLVFVYDLTWLSVLVMLGILFSLIQIILRTNMERWDAPIEIIAFVWWPICLYSGWIAVATIANIAAYLSKIGWTGGPISEAHWTVIMIVIATLVNLLMIWKRNMREFAAVGIWAFVAIYVRQEGTHPLISNVALGAAFILLVTILIHGAKNFKTNPFFKLLERIKT